jgi:hypothetical protein
MADKKYLEFIKKDPNYKPGGEIDENGFYNQPDGSKIYFLFQ